jgi:hypothetical protein
MIMLIVSDLAPVASTSSPIAAQAFIKVLSLASQDLIQVIEQDEAYGEVSNITSRLMVILRLIIYTSSNLKKVEKVLL